MSNFMPINNFRWLETNEYEKIDWISLSEKNDIGYIIECDLDYPQNLHKLHSEYPLCPEKLKIKESELSPYQKKLCDDMKKVNIKRIASEKLVLTLYDKKNYTLHYRNLKLYLELGMELKKIHKVLSFNQSAWIKPYIFLNTNLREKAKDKFEMDLIKLMNNAIYGKCCENVRSHLDVKLVMNELQTRRYLKRPLFEEFRIIDEKKALIRMRKSSIILNKPIIVGFSILEVSKCLMYEYHYNIFKKRYGDNCKLLYTDTDAFIYEIKTHDIYQDFSENLNEFMDTSNYPNDHYLFSEKRKKKLGFLKDESGGEIIEEFIGLKSKLYSIKYYNGETESKCKGLQKNVLKKFIKHENYKNVLFEDNILISETRRIKSKNFQLETIKTNKISHTPFDDKRFILDNIIDTLAFGYKSDNL